MDFEFKVTKDQEKKRLDAFLVSQFESLDVELSRSKIQDLIKNGDVKLKNLPQKLTPSYKVEDNEVFLVNLIETPTTELTPQIVDFTIIYEDDDLAIINKPIAISVHPGAGKEEVTLAHGLLKHFGNNLSDINGDFRPGIIHRLDKDTNGLMIIAKNNKSHELLSQMLQQHQIQRHYLAFIYGQIEPQKGKIEKNIIRSKRNRLKMTISNNEGRHAITNYNTIEIFGNGFASLVECKLETGRTHQIRVHFENSKHSLIGDKLYNSCRKQATKDLNPQLVKKINSFTRQALQSYKIEFIHPITSQEISFEIPLADDLKKLCHNLQQL